MSRVVVNKVLRSSRLLVLGSKALSPGKMIQPAAPVLGIWRSGYRRAGKQPFEPPTINELPIPHGPWDKWNQRENERYNRHLMFGLGFFLFTLYVVSQVVTFNFSPPPLPDNTDDLCPPPPKAQPKCV